MTRGTTQHIGAAGELLVQYRLLKHGIDSARLTTDSGVDLVAYLPASNQALTVQVKTQRRPRPSGGTGPLSVGWFFPHDLKADFLAVALLDSDDVWVFSRDEARELAQEHSARGIRQIHWLIEPKSRIDGTARRSARDVEHFQVDAYVARWFSE
ncbi:hypothetical protein [Plantibacter flavus]|uniref:hypothetical protein n=1 Tax=Plantibacter flavus TaxID=150123 RepID=UPI0010C17649|nr:hypothetical protein [Plantibacter flavus]